MLPKIQMQHKKMAKEFNCAVSAICKALKKEGITRKKDLKKVEEYKEKRYCKK